MALSRALPDPKWLGAACGGLGLALLRAGDPARAAPLLAESLAIAERLRDPVGTAGARWGLARAARAEGKADAAAALLGAALTELSNLGETWLASRCLDSLAVIAARGQPARATRLFGVTVALRETLGLRRAPVVEPGCASALATCKRALGEQPFAAAWAEGQAWPLDAAVADALAFAAALALAGDSTGAASDAAALSTRERDVLRLLAAGHPDREIAAALSISHTTARTHVRNILGKLGVPIRTAAAAYAFAHELD